MPYVSLMYILIILFALVCPGLACPVGKGSKLSMVLRVLSEDAIADLKSELRIWGRWTRKIVPISAVVFGCPGIDVSTKLKAEVLSALVVAVILHDAMTDKSGASTIKYISSDVSIVISSRIGSVLSGVTNVILCIYFGMLVFIAHLMCVDTLQK